jgi:hypothetical protein
MGEGFAFQARSEACRRVEEARPSTVEGNDPGAIEARPRPSCRPTRPSADADSKAARRKLSLWLRGPNRPICCDGVATEPNFG